MTRFEKDLNYGMFNTEVFRLQKFLDHFGYGKFAFMFIPLGSFGDATFEAVKKFQTASNILPVSGFFGPKSRAAANQMISDENRLALYTAAKKCIGLDASPNDLAPDEYGCAETVTEILRAVNINIPVILSTARLYIALLNRVDFTPTDRPLPGDIIISPTGMGNGDLPNGHVGIVGLNVIMSNSSADGTFRENYTMQSWKDRYVKMGGYPVIFFRRL